MKRRLFIFITGQYRKFWHAWNNLLENVIHPSQETFDIYVCVGLDAVWRTPRHLWTEMDRQVFETHLKNEWRNGFPIDHLHMEWLPHEDFFFQQAVSSLQRYTDQGQLDSYWFDYLTRRSGSCLEYAQISRLYEIVLSRYQVQDSDLMIRTRADILFRHVWNLDFVPEQSCTKEIFQKLFPTSSHFNHWQERDDRESSIRPSTFQQDRWIITLRKNLVYLTPLKNGHFLLQIAQHYGDWDDPQDNYYWFNAESQFRGCFRRHQFTLWEFSQDKDECYGSFHNLVDDFPIYAIYR